MRNQKEAGRKADAHRVRDLYRTSFGSTSKTIARRQTIEALKAAGVTTVLDLWGGGLSAEELVAAGFRVIAVEDGSMELLDNKRPVSQARKRRALEYAAEEGGYEARFGKAEKFAHEADGAFLDFCGPWSVAARRAVVASRHMKAVAVTLTPDHDTSTDAASPLEREMAYQLFLKMAWALPGVWASPNRAHSASRLVQQAGGVRRFLRYRRSKGIAVFVYLLSRTALHFRRLDATERRLLSHKEDEVRLFNRHRWHRSGAIPRTPCSLCEVAA